MSNDEGYDRWIEESELNADNDFQPSESFISDLVTSQFPKVHDALNTAIEKEPYTSGVKYMYNRKNLGGLTYQLINITTSTINDIIRTFPGVKLQTKNKHYAFAMNWAVETKKETLLTEAGFKVYKESILSDGVGGFAKEGFIYVRTH